MQTTMQTQTSQSLNGMFKGQNTDKEMIKELIFSELRINYLTYNISPLVDLAYLMQNRLQESTQLKLVCVCGCVCVCAHACKCLHMFTAFKEKEVQETSKE